MARYALVVVVETDGDADPVLLWETAAQDLELGGGGEAVYLSDPYKISEPVDAREYALVGLQLRGHDNYLIALTAADSALEHRKEP